MKKFAWEFVRRGLPACGLGPIVLAVLYLVLHHAAGMDSLSVHQVCVGIFSLSALAFVAGGISAIYQLERLPLMLAILIQGVVLYLCYLGTYLVNDWLVWGAFPVLVFSGIFIVGYFFIWMIVYSIVKRNTASVNEGLRLKRQKEKETA